jgi:hypothetical protein
VTVRVVTTTLLLAAIAGCGPRREVVPRQPPAERPHLSQTQIDSIAPVIDGLAEALAELAPKYPELAEYQAEKARVHGTYYMGLSYTHSFTRPRVKRGIRPSDYGENGFFISFGCSTVYPKGATFANARSIGMRDTVLRRLGLYIDVRFGAGPAPREDLIREIGGLVDKHIDKLKRIDGEEPSPSK